MALNRKKATIVAGVVGAIVVLIVVAASAGLLGGILKKSPAETAKAAGVVATAAQVRIPLGALDSGKALFLETEHAGRTIHFFALKGSDGAYRAALDACDVCFKSNKGYRQEGDWMVCNNCGQRFPSARIGEVKGGCNPHPLVREVQGDHLVIDQADLQAGARYFPGKRT